MLPFNLFAQEIFPVIKKESNVMSEVAVGVPAVVPVGVSHGHSGFSPADASLVHAIGTSSEARSNLIETSASAKDGLVQTVTNRFETERAVKQSELATERSARQSDAALQTVRSEIMQSMNAEHAKTRELIFANENTRLASALADAQQSTLVDKLTRIITKLGA